MLARPVLRRPLPRRLPRPLAATVAALVAVPGLALLSMAPAHAALNSPTAGSTQSGVVSVREANGASNNCVAGQGSPYTRFQVTRADGTVVGSDQQSGTGAKTYAWSSVGQPRGAYVARSWTRSAEKSGFLNLGCSNRSEVAQPTVSFTVPCAETAVDQTANPIARRSFVSRTPASITNARHPRAIALVASRSPK